LQYIVVYIIGGAGYGLLELAYRGYTHWTMLIAGGASGIALYLIANAPSLGKIKQYILGGAVITVIEWLFGIVVNVKLGWDVWDYSDNPLNLKGQICLYYSLLWVGISVPGTYVCRKLHKAFNRPTL